MAYSNYQIENTVFSGQSFATNATRKTRMSKGHRGRLMDVKIEATTTFTATTTQGQLKLGTATDDDAFGTFNLGTLAAGSVYVATKDEPKAIIDTEIPMDTEIVATIVAPTGGSPAGAGTVTISINEY